MEIIGQYLDEVCSCVTNAAYRRAVRRELENHLEDSIEYAERNGSDRAEAAKKAIAEMGDAREMGNRMNRQFKIQPDFRVIVYILGILLLYIAAGIKINFSLRDTMLTLAVYGTSIYLLSFLPKVDLEGKSRSIKYLYLGTFLLLLPICIFADMKYSRECMSIGGVILFFCVTFFVYRVSKSGALGLAAAVCSFVLPIPLFILSAAYAALFLYVATGICTFSCFIAQGWTIKGYVKAIFFVLMIILLGCILLLCKSNIYMKWKLWEFFFLRDGMNHFSYLSENFKTYPLAACISHFGVWTMMVYLILLSLVLAELVRMKKKVHCIWGRNVLNCIVFTFSVKAIMAVLLNLGVPWIRSYMLPFTGLGGDQISNLILIALAEYVYCMGDAVFSDYSFFDANRLFRIENGTITFYFQGKDL